MKKIISTLLMVAVLVTCMATVAFAADSTTLTVQTKELYASEVAGQEVKLAVTADVGVSAYNFTINYNTAELKLARVEFPSAAKSSAVSGNNVGARMEMGKTFPNNILCYVVFTVVDSNVQVGDYYKVSLTMRSNDGVYDEKGTDMKVSFNAGGIKIKEAPHEHNYTFVKTVAPTCNEKGYDVYKCSCGLTENRNYVNALGHDWNDGVVTKDAKCTEEGVKTYTCNRCGETKTEAIAKLGHKAGDAVTEAGKAPTCTVDGYHYTVVTCSRCNVEISRDKIVDPALGHDMDEGVVTKEATCTEAGVKTFTCKRCGYTMTEAIAALGHDWDNGVVTKEATCTEEGVKTFTCKNCGETKTESIAKLNHKDSYAYDDTYHWFVCELCGRKTDKVKHDHCIEYNNRLYCECGHSVEMPTEPSKPNDDLDDVPETGDITDQVIFGSVAALAALAAAAYVCMRKFAK